MSWGRYGVLIVVSMELACNEEVGSAEIGGKTVCRVRLRCRSISKSCGRARYSSVFRSKMVWEGDKVEGVRAMFGLVKVGGCMGVWSGGGWVSAIVAWSNSSSSRRRRVTFKPEGEMG